MWFDSRASAYGDAHAEVYDDIYGPRFDPKDAVKATAPTRHGWRRQRKREQHRRYGEAIAPASVPEPCTERQAACDDEPLPCESGGWRTVTSDVHPVRMTSTVSSW